MKLHALLFVGLALGFSGCAEKEKAAPPQVDEPATSMESGAPPPAAAGESYEVSDAVVRHMHLHAEQLDRLNRALAAGDLEAAHTPAYWLSRHEGMSVFPAEWEPNLQKMRAAARAVETAPDLETARVAAAQLANACQGCHTDAGFEVEIVEVGAVSK